MTEAEYDDLKRLAKLLFWYVPRDKLAEFLRELADEIEVKEQRKP
jgi:hypothetical protein